MFSMDLSFVICIADLTDNSPPDRPFAIRFKTSSFRSFRSKYPSNRMDYALKFFHSYPTNCFYDYFCLYLHFLFVMAYLF